MKKRNKWIVAGIAALLAVLWCVGFVHANLQYPPSKKVTIPAGEAAVFQNVEMRVLSGEWIDPSALSEDDPLHSALKGDVSGEENGVLGLVVEYEFYNPTEENVTVDMTTVNIESGNASTPFGRLINYYEQVGIYQTVEAGKTLRVKGIVTFLRSHFIESEWKHLTERQFYFVTTLYPVKQMALIPADPLT